MTQEEIQALMLRIGKIGEPHPDFRLVHVMCRMAGWRYVPDGRDYHWIDLNDPMIEVESQFSLQSAGSLHKCDTVFAATFDEGLRQLVDKLEAEALTGGGWPSDAEVLQANETARIERLEKAAEKEAAECPHKE